MLTCSGFYVSVYRGREAIAYADEHLRLISGAGTYVVGYGCPDHGKGWILDWVGAENHGGMTVDQARLRTFAEVRMEAIGAIAAAGAITDDSRILGLIDDLSASLDALREPPRYS